MLTTGRDEAFPETCFGRLTMLERSIDLVFLLSYTLFFFGQVVEVTF
jgi:hypothetical protein